jgi:hypothetical protein
MPEPHSPPPLLVSVVEARRLLGDISNNKFWKLVRAGDLEIVGTERKRWAVVESLHAYVARLREQAACKSLKPAAVQKSKALPAA